jgi:hypothetical protein
MAWGGTIRNTNISARRLLSFSEFDCRFDGDPAILGGAEFDILFGTGRHGASGRAFCGGAFVRIFCGVLGFADDERFARTYFVDVVDLDGSDLVRLMER